MTRSAVDRRPTALVSAGAAYGSRPAGIPFLDEHHRPCSFSTRQATQDHTT